MSSSQRPSGVVHQDYIARIRYSNALPPPPNPPKLLNIPGTGLAGGQYTSAGYASKLAREQPLNIEADAELGMPIDLVGVPGIFDGDERAISARPAPVLDPKDKQLLKPLSAIGKANSAGGAVSFLRRTEYISSQGSQHFSSSTSKDLLRLRNDPKRRKTNVNKDDPVNIIRNVVKGFDIAYPRDAYKGDDNTVGVRGAAISEAEAKAWSNPKHPTRSTLQLLDSYPVLPDLDALPTNGTYMVTKFISNPEGMSDSYDERLNSAILRPINDPQTQADYQRRLAEWNPNSGKVQPLPEYDFDYYHAAETDAVKGIKRKFDVNDPDNEDIELYTDDLPDGQRGFKYTRLRRYETYNQHGDPDNYYNDSIALALHDPESEVGVVPGTKNRLNKAAYYYPIIQRTALRPKRNVGRQAFSQQVDEERIDELNVKVTDFAEEERTRQLEKRAELDRSVKLETARPIETAAS